MNWRAVVIAGACILPSCSALPPDVAAVARPEVPAITVSEANAKLAVLDGELVKLEGYLIHINANDFILTSGTIREPGRADCRLAEHEFAIWFASDSSDFKKVDGLRRITIVATFQSVLSQQPFVRLEYPVGAAATVLGPVKDARLLTVFDDHRADFE